ncbi:Glycosyltransferase AglE [uncultured archaeon]|nr:Glycosyltransferase AglE [uncultured archaeon]
MLSHSEDYNVYILIPIHNNIAETRKCLSCIHNQTYNNYEVVVIDDGSTDNSTEIIKNVYPDTTILQGDGNLWWAGALFMGIEHILKKADDKDFLLILNNDVTFDEIYIETLINCSKDSQNTIIGSLCIDSETGKIADSGPIIDWSKLKFSIKPLIDDNKDIIEGLDTLSTRGVLIRISIIKKIGNFIPEQLPHYASDYEYFIRAKNKEYKLIMSKKAVVFSNSSTTGIHYLDDVNGIKELYKYLFSIKSAANVIIWLRFTKLCCPSKYKILNYLRIIGRAFIASIIIMFKLKINKIKLITKSV